MRGIKACDLAWTIAGLVVSTAIGLLVLGRAPFAAFLTYEAPRLVSSEALSFIDRPSQSAFITSRNFAITGIGARRYLLGLPAPTHGKFAVLASAFTALLIWLATFVQRERETRVSRLIGWLAPLASQGREVAGGPRRWWGSVSGRRCARRRT